MAIFMLAIFVFSALPIEAKQNEISGNSIKNINREAIQKYNAVKVRYQTTAQEWEKVNREFTGVRNRIKNYDNLNLSEQDRVLERTRNFLEKTMDRMDSHLDILESWVERINIPEERKEIILKIIEEKRLEIEGYRNKVSETNDLESLRYHSKEIKESWHGFLPKIKGIRGELLTTKIGNILEDSDNLALSLQEKIVALDQESSEVLEMQTLLDSYNEKLDLAREQYELAKEKYEEIEDLSDANDLFEETKEFVFKSREYLRESHKILIQLVRNYRDFTGEVPEQNTDNNELDRR